MSELFSDGDGDEIGLDELLDLDRGRIQTPADPFDRLVLNPGVSNAASGNPLCPDCEEPIKPWSNQYQRRFICGCEDAKRFSFSPQDTDRQEVEP